MSDFDVTIVFPCLNEEAAVGVSVSDALEAFKAGGLRGEVVVVDNGSTDRSVELALEAGARVLRQPVPGYGAALRTGITAARGSIVVMADADGTYELAKIPRMVAMVQDGEADLVLGARLKSAKGESMPFMHRFLGTPVLSYLVNRAANGRQVSDSQSGFRVFRRDEILALNLHSTGMEFASEMLISAAWHNLRIAEVETTYSVRIGESKLSTIRDGWRHLRAIFLLAPDLFLITPSAVVGILALAMVLISGLVLAPNGYGIWWSVAFNLSIIACILSPLVMGAGFLLRARGRDTGLRPYDPKSHTDALRNMMIIGGFLMVLAAVFGCLLAASHASANPWALQHVRLEFMLSSLFRMLAVVGIILFGTPVVLRLNESRPAEVLPEGQPVDQVTSNRGQVKVDVDPTKVAASGLDA